MKIEEMIDYTIGVRRHYADVINEGIGKAGDRAGKQITKLMTEEYRGYGAADMKIERLIRGYVRKGDLD